ncbi:unnamed protein product [Nesidiocoris tenuis]|uniref:Uncharacterized protein n=1 Tax=Nesidiocoris tenuis TaxID=355587 RepID=A0A6H5HNB2_9HEMI|nr:unnamed protein product [Nesidiocoris tenuis]
MIHRNLPQSRLCGISTPQPPIQVCLLLLHRQVSRPSSHGSVGEVCGRAGLRTRLGAFLDLTRNISDRRWRVLLPIRPEDCRISYSVIPHQGDSRMPNSGSRGTGVAEQSVWRHRLSVQSSNPGLGIFVTLAVLRSAEM